VAQRATSRRPRDIALILLLLGLPILFLEVNLRGPGARLNLLDRVILRISAPIEAGVTFCLRGMGGVWHHYVALVGVQQENDQLRSENSQLRTELVAESQAAARADEYERLLGIKQDLTQETLAAHAIAYQTSGFYRILRIRIDRGDADVTRGMPVLSADGVIGTIKDTYGDYSDVQLATDPGSGIDVVVVPPETDTPASVEETDRPEVRAVLKGLGDGERAYLDSLRLSDQVEVGDLVLTSGVRPFPADLAIGRVVRVSRPTAGMSQEADVEMTADFSRLSDVLVLLPNAQASR
jgi:rod shape-determining protein MreC